MSPCFRPRPAVLEPRRSQSRVRLQHVGRFLQPMCLLTFSSFECSWCSSSWLLSWWMMRLLLWEGGSMVASCPASRSCRCLFFSFSKSSAIRNVSSTNLSSNFSTRCLPVVVSDKHFKNLSLYAGVFGLVDVRSRATHLRLLQPVPGP